MAFASYRSTLETIYHAARDPAGWSKALEQTADYVGGTGALIAHHDLSRNEGSLIVGRLREDLSELYVRRYGRNPFSVAIVRHPIGSVQIAGRLADPAAVRKTAFHADILAPQRIVEKLMVAHAPFMTQTHTGGFAVTLDQRGADDAERRCRRMARLTPHLSAALELTHLVAALATSSRQLQAVMEAMPLAAMIVDAGGRIEGLNAACEAMLSRGDCLRVEPGRIVTTVDPSNAADISALLASASASDANTRVCRIHTTSGALRLVKASPLPDTVVEAWEGRPRGDRVLLQIVDPFSAGDRALDRGWRDLFGLTPAEARTATLFGRGLSAGETANRLGVSITTVRTHIAHCFSKTGVHSQAALARLMAAVDQLDRGS